MTPQKDKELAARMRAAIAGDTAGYDQLLREIAGLVRGLVSRKLGPGSAIDVEDIVQETLLAVHLKRHTWRPDAPILPWVYAIARYKVIDAFRRRGHQQVTLDIDGFADVLAAEETETASTRDIERALASLSDGQRRVVAAISVDGHSIAEAAGVLGMKETAVRVALHRGLAAIAAKFGKTD